MPACATRYAGSPAISFPRKSTEPAVGRNAPAIRLKVVLLPEPFGPMRPRISPSATSKDTPLTARKPSNDLVSPRTSSTYDAVVTGSPPSRGRRFLLGSERVTLGERQYRVGR